MRRATIADRDEVVAMIRARADWMRKHGHDRWRSWQRDADTLGDQIGQPDWPVWVLTTSDADVIGCTTVTYLTPALGWTQQEQAEPAVFLQTTVTHPNRVGEGLGMLIAFWALDHAAHHHKHWVRRGVLTDDTNANLGLVRYYQLQGWRVVRALSHPRKPTITAWSLERPAQRQPDLAELLTELAIAGRPR